MMEASNQIVCLCYPDYDGDLKSEIVCLSYPDYDGSLKSHSVSQVIQTMMGALNQIVCLRLSKL